MIDHRYHALFDAAAAIGVDLQVSEFDAPTVRRRPAIVRREVR